MAKTEKYGINWKYHQPFVASCHEDLSTSNATYISTLGGSFTDGEGNTIYKADAYALLRGFLAKFFNIVRPLFSMYLVSKDFAADWEGFELKIDCVRDYEIIIEDYQGKHMNKILDAVKVILFWANKHGPFATYTHTPHFESDEEFLESRE